MLQYLLLFTEFLFFKSTVCCTYEDYIQLFYAIIDVLTLLASSLAFPERTGRFCWEHHFIALMPSMATSALQLGRRCLSSLLSDITYTYCLYLFCCF